MRRQAQLGKPRVVVFNEYDFLLRAVNGDLGNVRLLEEFIAQLVRHGLQLGVGKAVAGECVDAAEHVAKLIVDLGRLRALRQVRRDAVHLAAQIVEDRPHHLVAFLEVGVDHRNTRARLAGDRVDLGHFLDLLFDLVGDQQLDAFGACPGEARRYDRRSHDESRILRFWQALKRENTGDNNQRHDCQRNPVLFDGCGSKIHERRRILVCRRHQHALPVTDHRDAGGNHTIADRQALEHLDPGLR